MISIFVLHLGCSGSPSGAVLGLVGGASPPRVADSNAIAARLQGPLLGVGLDELSIEAAERRATRRLRKIGFESSARRA